MDLLHNLLKRRGGATAPAAGPDDGQHRGGEGRARVVIESVAPQIDCGRYPVKRVVGETVLAQADAFADGHDVVVCLLRYRHEAEQEWTELAMTPLGNDHWQASFVVSRLGTYRYTVVAWVDHLRTWRHDLGRREDAADIRVAAQIGARLIGEAADRADAGDGAGLRAWAQRLAEAQEPAEVKEIAADSAMMLLAERHADRRFATQFEHELLVTVDRERARYSTWYELFPRSAADEPGRHGTFADCLARLPYIAEMGFDVLYLPPIHPIGRAYRKGRNNALAAGSDDVGSPWAIGGAEGGHKSIHPQLGTLEDFGRLRTAAAEPTTRMCSRARVTAV